MRAKKLPRKELDELASSVVRGEVYLARVGEDPSFEHSFGWLFMMLDPPLSKSQAATIGACYAPMKNALPRAINGYPMFAGCKIVHVDDVMSLHWRIVRKQRALDGVPVLRRALLRVMGR
jgi:hypothetical protein